MAKKTASRAELMALVRQNHVSAPESSARFYALWNELMAKFEPQRKKRLIEDLVMLSNSMAVFDHTALGHRVKPETVVQHLSHVMTEYVIESVRVHIVEKEKRK